MVHNDYFKCYYNGNPDQLLRQDLYDKWDIHFDSSVIESRLLKSFKEEFLASCELMYSEFKQYTPRLNLFFSGGTDSESMVRCFRELHIPINPIILIHKGIEDRDETEIALSVCDELNVKPTIINIDLFELYNSGILHDMGRKYQTANLAVLQILYAITLLGEPSIVADEVRLNYRCPYAYMVNKRESSYSEWSYTIHEDWFNGIYDRFFHHTRIPTIADPFRYTPQSWAAMITTNSMKDIVFNNRHKATSNSTKNMMMSKEFGVRLRNKTGISALSKYPSLFHKLILDMRPYLLPYTIREIEYSTLLSLLGVVNGL